MYVSDYTECLNARSGSLCTSILHLTFFRLSAQLEARSLHFLSAHQKHSNCHFYVLTLSIHQSSLQLYHQFCEAALCQNGVPSSKLCSEKLTQSSVASGRNVEASWTIKLTLNNTVTSTSATCVPAFSQIFRVVAPTGIFPGIGKYLFS